LRRLTVLATLCGPLMLALAGPTLAQEESFVDTTPQVGHLPRGLRGLRGYRDGATRLPDPEDLAALQAGTLDESDIPEGEAPLAPATGNRPLVVLHTGVEGVACRARRFRIGGHEVASDVEALGRRFRLGTRVSLAPASGARRPGAAGSPRLPTPFFRNRFRWTAAAPGIPPPSGTVRRRRERGQGRGGRPGRRGPSTPRRSPPGSPPRARGTRRCARAPLRGP
jgi:hypothetical protein